MIFGLNQFPKLRIQRDQIFWGVFLFFFVKIFLNGTSEILTRPFLSAKRIILSAMRHYFVAQGSKIVIVWYPENVVRCRVLRLEMHVLLITFELTSAGFFEVFIFNFKHIFKENFQKHSIASRICQIVTQSRDKIVWFFALSEQ